MHLYRLFEGELKGAGSFDVSRETLTGFVTGDDPEIAKYAKENAERVEQCLAPLRELDVAALRQPVPGMVKFELVLHTRKSTFKDIPVVFSHSFIPPSDGTLNFHLDSTQGVISPNASRDNPAGLAADLAVNREPCKELKGKGEDLHFAPVTGGNAVSSVGLTCPVRVTQGQEQMLVTKLSYRGNCGDANGDMTFCEHKSTIVRYTFVPTRLPPKECSWFERIFGCSK